jgi:hypothetical protein
MTLIYGSPPKNPEIRAKKMSSEILIKFLKFIGFMNACYYVRCFDPQL